MRPAFVRAFLFGGSSVSDAATEVTETQTTNDPSDEALEHAMASGFSGVRGTEPPAPLKTEETSATQGTPNQESNAATEQSAATGDDAGAVTGEEGGVGETATQEQQTEQEQQVEAAKAVLAGLSEEQLKAVLGEVPVMRERLTAAEQNLQKVFGRFGEVNRVLQALSKGGSAQAVKIDASKLKRLSSVFDEQAAEALASDLQDILSEIPRGAGEPVDLDNRIDTRVQTVQQAIQRTVNEMFLSHAHPDWKDAVGTADFRLWLETKPAEERAQIRESEDAGFLLPKFNEFKSWRSRAAQNRENKGRRLESSVDPKGQPAPATTSSQRVPDEEAAFATGFKAARGVAA